MSLDFSQAPTTQERAPSLTFDEVAGALAARGLDAIRYILPGGRIDGHEYCIGDLAGNKGKSLKVNTKTFAWSDFACGVAGGDLVSLWAAKNNLTQAEARDEAAEWLGMQPPVPSGWLAPAPPPPPQLVERGSRPGEIVYKYETPDGQPYLEVVRGADKSFSQWTPVEGGRFIKGAPPAPRHIYNLPAVLAAPLVVVVEGEKKVHALAEVGYVATTCVGGSSGVKQSDWGPLTGKRVVIWRDNDEPGVKHAQAVEAAISRAQWVTHVDIPAGKPAKWDAADAEPAERRALIEAAIARAPHTFDPDIWDMTKYQGTPEPTRMLVAGTLPLGKAGLVAAMGDTGKSMLLLDLALTIATCSEADSKSHTPPMAFGGRVLEFGTAVIFSAEDDRAELHRRLIGMDPEGMRRKGMDPRRLRLVPFPSAGGTVPLIQQDRDHLATTERFTLLRKWLKTLPDLKLIVIDPLAAFVQAALDNDNSAAAFTMSVFGAIAAETGACVVAAHHVRKSDGEISNVAEARAQVRGASGLVDGSRFTYVLWPSPDLEAQRVCERLEVKHEPGRVIRGAVVKSNGPADRTIKLFVRNEANGLLEDRTESERARRRQHDEELIDSLVTLVQAFVPGTGRKPFIAYGKGGLFSRREELGDSFAGMGKGKLESLVSQAIKSGRLVRGNDGTLRVA